MSGIFTVLIALGLMQPAPVIDDRREACNTWADRCDDDFDVTPESQMIEAKKLLAVWIVKQSNWNSPLSHAAGELELMRAEGEAELRKRMPVTALSAFVLHSKAVHSEAELRRQMP
jgi:hypothetical protein